MSEDRPRGPVSAAMREDEAEVRDLLAGAGRRPDVPAEDLAALREMARAEWARRYAGATARRSRTPWGLGLAAAAMLAVALGLVWWTRRGVPPAPPTVAVATVERVSGSAAWRNEARRGGRLGRGNTGLLLGAGTVVETSGSGTPSPRMALRLLDGPSLRLDGDTRVRLVSPREVQLLAGALYVDSPGDPAPGRAGLSVRTAHGTFQELGTQFEVRLLAGAEGERVRLRVREGRVALDRDRVAGVVGEAGEELLVADHRVERRRIAPDDPDWSWVLDAAPPFVAQDPTVREVLDWVAREAGWRLELADADVAAIADGTTVHGSIAHFRPTEALRPVLHSAGLSHRIEGGRLIVTAPPLAR